MSNKDKLLPVDKLKYASRTYRDTGQPWIGLGPWLRYQQHKFQKETK